MNKSKRLFEIDALRGIAAISVVIYHYTTWYDELYGHSQEVIFHLPKGKYGVELFFIISGFVIFMSLEKIKVSLDFVVGRFSRLYPAYWASVILTFIIVTVAGLPYEQVSWHDALVNLTMLQGFFNVPHVDGAYWTLELELCFYIIMFVLHRVKLLKHINVITIGWLFLMVAVVLLEQNTNLVIDQRISTFLLLKHGSSYVYANLFISGMMYYKIHQEGFALERYGIMAACILVYKLEHSWAEVLIVFAFVILFNFILKRRLTFLNHKPLMFLGTISYSLYLVHQNIGYVIIRELYKFNINPNTSIFIAVLVSVLLAIRITFMIEQPIMSIIQRYYKTKVLKQV